MKITYKLNDAEAVAKQLLRQVKSKTLLFYGDMGAGKTTLISAIVKALGSKDYVSSPTFSIVNEYRAMDHIIYHFDMYRIESIEEAYNFGIEDYLESESWKLIEWPNKIEDILFDDFDKIELELGTDNSRILFLE
ncbi:tRNA (adenosine(37)-N6)-threonylcarbamoyltransferase complex ATPase subunit type 1 TsaE [uncultured Algibacter sp.]|uniref:tRNA (adenosine(37)-N6)-threonylcarbamoyltransferase complex ATPase subunit type 1 TsaE n=1 Tax=uncultured Algibacter sp. TaxID=298659 RepID=UPI00261D6754|nr:tRNA (adenosine(37)-N6)-threonylcarbamoyltransferase complex ATPase subunit type 1 TsaE [uncultured Algibacter sp.]